MNIYVARQPIFDRRQKVYAYELLYRTGEDNFNPESDGNLATAEVIANSILAIGLDRLTRRKRAFINFSKQLIEEEVAFLLPKDYIAIEINESVELDEDILDALKKLRSSGYVIAYDDYRHSPQAKDMLNLVDMIKVDYQVTGAEERARIAEYFQGTKIKIIAERIETVQEYGDAMACGYDYFQGYFFCEPTIIAGRDIPSTKLHNLRLLQEIYKQEMDYDQVESLVKQDPSLSYKLLRFINSIAFPVRFPIRSIRQAIALLGQKEMIKWASLVALRNVGYDKPDELMVTAVCRAKFCESVALSTTLKERSADLFLTGLFSLLDTFLDQPMHQILKELPLEDDIKSALLGERGPLCDVLDLVLLYEKGFWDKAFTLAADKFKFDEVEMMSYYLEALELADMAWKT